MVPVPQVSILACSLSWSSARSGHSHDAQMEYIDVIWKHLLDEEPVRLVSELGDDRFECRKLEFFRDGAVDVADCRRETSRTRLGLVAVPTVVEINQDSEFEAVTISATTFETLWLTYARPSDH